jgi:hypothetical protein
MGAQQLEVFLPMLATQDKIPASANNQALIT